MPHVELLALVELSLGEAIIALLEREGKSGPNESGGGGKELHKTHL